MQNRRMCARHTTLYACHVEQLPSPNLRACKNLAMSLPQRRIIRMHERLQPTVVLPSALQLDKD